jgi:hypothetical protein
MSGNAGYQGFPSTLISNTFNSSMAGDTCDAQSPADFIAANPRQPGQLVLALSGSKTTGNTITLTLLNGAFPGGSVAVSYTALSGDTLASMAEGLSNAVTSDPTLQQYDVFALVYQSEIEINQLGPVSNFTTVAVSLSVGATCAVALTNPTQSTVTVGGTATSTDVVTLGVNNGDLPGGVVDVNYTVQVSDGLNDIAAGLAAAVNANTTLAAASITASYTSGAVFTVNQTGSIHATLSDDSAGSPTESLSFVDNAGALTDGSGAAVPLQNLPVQVGNSVIQLRYFIPVLLPFVTLKQLCNQGTAIK